MSSSYPATTRPVGRALVIASAACRLQPLAVLERLGYSCAEVDEPYAAMAELCRRPLVYHALVLSLSSLYREELALIGAVKKRWPHIGVWLTQTEGRLASLADAMRLGADGLLDEQGLHHTAPTPPSANSETPSAAEAEMAEMDSVGPDAVLSAEELRALLQEQPTGNL